MPRGPDWLSAALLCSLPTIAPIPIHLCISFIHCHLPSNAFTHLFPSSSIPLIHHLSFCYSLFLLHFLPSPPPYLPLQSKLKGLQQQVKTLLDKAKVQFDAKVCWSPQQHHPFFHIFHPPTVVLTTEGWIDPQQVTTVRTEGTKPYTTIAQQRCVQCA